MYGIKESFKIILREDVLYVSPKKFILLYFDRNGLQSFEHSITPSQFLLFKKYYNLDTIHYRILALGFAFEIKNGRK